MSQKYFNKKCISAIKTDFSMLIFLFFFEINVRNVKSNRITQLLHKFARNKLYVILILVMN